MGDARESVVVPNLGLVKGYPMEELIAIDGGASSGGKSGGHHGNDPAAGGKATRFESSAQLGADVATQCRVDLFEDELVWLAKQGTVHCPCDAGSGLCRREMAGVAVDGEDLILGVFVEVFEADSRIEARAGACVGAVSSARKVISENEKFPHQFLSSAWDRF
jgi:hypothetical protein